MSLRADVRDLRRKSRKAWSFENMGKCMKSIKEQMGIAFIASSKKLEVVDNERLFLLALTLWLVKCFEILSL